MGKHPVKQNFLHPVTQTMCCAIMGSADPLGFTAAFWEHYSPSLRAFLWKMSPASDESESCFSAACPAPGWGPHGCLAAVVWTSIFLSKERLCYQHTCSRAAGTRAGRDAFGWCLWDRQTHRCYGARSSRDPWPRHFHSSCNCDSGKVVHQVDYQLKGKGRG